MTACNNVILNGTTLIDLQNDTVVAGALLHGYTAHKADGTVITGTLYDDYSQPIVMFDDLTDEDDYGIEDSSGAVIQGCTVFARQ